MPEIMGDKPLRSRCGVLGLEKCVRTIRVNPALVFVAHPYGGKFPTEDYRNLLLQVSKDKPFNFSFADERIDSGPILCKICGMMQEACLCVFDVSYWNPNVTLELGLAYGLGLTPVIFFMKSSKRNVPSDIQGLGRAEYETLIDLKNKLESMVVPMIPSVVKESYPFIVLSRKVDVEFRDYTDKHHEQNWIYRDHIRAIRSGEADFELEIRTAGEITRIESLSHGPEALSVLQRSPGGKHIVRTYLGYLKEGSETTVETMTVRKVENELDPHNYIDFEMDFVSKEEWWIAPFTLYQTDIMEYTVVFSSQKIASQYIGTRKLVGTKWFEDTDAKIELSRSGRFLRWRKRHPQPNVRYMIIWKW